MSNFICEHCKKIILDTPNGYITSCEHYSTKRISKRFAYMKRNKRILEEYKKHTRIRELSEIYDISNERVRKIILKQMSREEYWKIKQDRHERTVKELKAKYYNRYHTDEEYRKKIIESVKKNQNKK